MGYLHMLSVWDKNYRIRSQVPLTPIQPSERPNLKGKEIITNVKVIKYSLKRSREVEPSPDTKTDSELSSLYLDESISAKKHRPSDEKENVEDDQSVDILTSLLDEHESDDSEVVNSNNSENSQTSSKDDNSKASISVNEEDLNVKDSHSVAFTEESLVSVDKSPTNSNLVNTSSQEDFTLRSNSDVISRNRFAVHTKIKDRFNINATKVEVKSRFFAQSSPVDSKMEIASPERPKVDKLTFKSPKQNRFERNHLSNMDNSLSISSEEIMQKGRTSSNASAFSWRQQQFVRNQSMDNFSTLKSGNNQPNLNQHFQVPNIHCNPLVRHNSDGGSRIGGSRDGNSRTMPENDAYTSRNLNNDCGQSDINQSVTASTFFNMSRCPSMNLSESPGSQDDDAERGSQKHTPVNSPIESWIGSNEELKSPSSHSSTPVIDALPQLPSTPKPACRVSGLSKSRGGKSKQSHAGTGGTKPSGQQSIKDMFSKFAYSKGSKPLST